MGEIVIKMSTCVECAAVAPKFYDNKGVFQTGEFVERGEKGYDFVFYQNGNNPTSHRYCEPCLENYLERIEEGFGGDKK